MSDDAELMAFGAEIRRQRVLSKPSWEFGLEMEENIGRVHLKSAAYAQAITDMLVEYKGVKPITVKFSNAYSGMTNGRAYHSGRVIKLYNGGRSLRTLIHEVAHLCLPYGVKHGKRWKAMFLELSKFYVDNMKDADHVELGLGHNLTLEERLGLLGEEATE